MVEASLAHYCLPEIAASVVKLAQGTPLDRFLASAALFCRAPREVLEAVWRAEHGEAAGAARAGANPANPANEPEKRATNELSPSPARSPSPPPRSPSPRLPPRSPSPPARSPPARSPAPPRSPGALYYTDRSPFTGTAELVQVLKQPRGNLAQRSKSDLVKSLRQERERSAAVRSKTAARGTLAALAVENLGPAAPTRARDTRSFAELQHARTRLPAYAARNELLQIIRENQVVIVVGETGSGKTTQIPQFLFEAGYGGTIGCTQPRRVAAISVAERVAAERGATLGAQVGYTIRFEDKTSNQTKIKFLTDGILLREALADPTLEHYSCIIIDEAHERALNSDILLGVFKRILLQRNDLKLVITSATINAALFSQFYGGAPIYTIPGRTFPVHVTNIKSPIADYVQAAVNQTLSIHLRGLEGDVLVFMTGQDDIEATCQHLESTLAQLQGAQPLEILPLYSQLPADLQQRIFLPSEHRKVIVATNIAETSLTVEGIRHVVDPGYTKINVYQPRYGIDTLQVVPISRANAAQRAGRAGRTSEGFAYRLYTKLAEHEEMHEQPLPEIRRTNLANTLLLLKGLGCERIEEFAFLDSPDPAAIQSSLKDLWTIGAIDTAGKITNLGQRLTNYPLDPFIARMLVASIDHGCAQDMLTIVAMISAPCLFIRSNERAKEADAAHERFQNPKSDHLTLLHIYNEWRRNNESSEWCRQNFFQYRGLRYAKSIRGQLARMLPAAGAAAPAGAALAPATCPDTLRKCICMAYFHQSARAKGLQSFVGFSNGVEMALHPTSSLNGLGHIPSFVVYHNLILTSRQLMSTVTAVEPEWLLEYGSVYFSNGEPAPEPASAAAPERQEKPRFKRQKLKANPVNKKFMRGM